MRCAGWAARISRQTRNSIRTTRGVEITSTGPLPFGLTPEDLTRPHQSRPWNPSIAGTLFRRGIIETWGRGTLKIIELAQTTGLPEPEFEATRHTVTVRFRTG